MTTRPNHARQRPSHRPPLWQPEINLYEMPLSRNLFSNNECKIVQDYRGYIIANIHQPWSKKLEYLLHKYQADGISVVLAARSKDNSLEFLEKFPDLKLLILYGGLETQWERIDGLSKLEHLHILSSSETSAPINFIGLKRLRVCKLNSCPMWTDILHHPQVQSLAWQGDFKNRVLDCSAMPKLKEIAIDSSPKLRNVLIHDSTSLLSLGIEKCRAFAPCWERLCQDLRFLAIQGKVAFPLSEIRKARNLRSLLLFNVGKLQSVEFLKSLRSLEWLRFIDVNLSEAECKIYKQIKATLRSSSDAS